MNTNICDFKECSACGVCKILCPKGAIELKKDKRGFLCATVDNDKCVNCGLCYSKCFNNNEIKGNSPIECYAMAMREKKEILESTSGGAFASIAQQVLKKGGVVYGAALYREKENLVIEHIRIDNIKDLIKIKGSKYVQSDISNILKLVKKDLIDERKVLFSGTPCQIAALKSYLNREYDNLLTIDIICHGVPSYDLFKSYIKFLEEKNKGKVIDYKFRDKRRGWGHSTSYIIQKNEKKVCKRVIVPLDAYYKMFLKGETYRENCYNCKFANKKRISDITIGDYWGIEIEHPEAIEKNGGKLNDHKGVSCILINTIKGEKLFDDIKSQINYYNTTFDKIAKHNHQLVEATKFSDDRKTIFNIYEKKGDFKAIHDWYMKKIGLKKYVYWFANMLPPQIKKILRKVER